MAKQINPIPIYSTDGDLHAFLVYPLIYNNNGEWIGFVTSGREVYSVHGDYVGWLSDDPRILRKRSIDLNKPKLAPPRIPTKFIVPSRKPLAPMMSELGFETVDVLQDFSDLLPTLDAGELREDAE